MGTVVEIHHDEDGILWPEEVAPYKIHLIELKTPRPRQGEAEGGQNSKLKTKVSAAADDLYKDLLAKGTEVLYDDRDDKTPGEKFSDADLLGVPWRVVISEKTLEKNGVEIKKRGEKQTKIITTEEILKMK